MSQTRTMAAEQLEIWVKQLIKDNNIHAFYISKTWLKVKKEVLNEQHHECQRCKNKGIYKRAATVHHKKYLRRYPMLALTKSNLEAICEECHYDEHHRKTNQWNDEKW